MNEPTPWPRPTEPPPIQVLVVESDEDDFASIRRELEQSSHVFVFRRVETGPEFRDALTEARWDAVIAAYRNPALDGLAALTVVDEVAADVPVLMVSGKVGEEAAVEAMKAGARDFLTKDRLHRLVPALERELREVRVRQDRDRLAEHLRQIQKMEAVGRLAGDIAHDFNNLLTAIRGYADLALAEMPPDDPVWNDVEQIVHASDRASNLTAQLLAFGRRQVVPPRVHDLNTLVARAEDLLRRLVGDQVQLTTALVPQSAHVRVDAGQVEQVLVALAVNAREAMPNGGRLEVETRLVDLDEAYRDRHGEVAPGDYVMLSVSDDGVGMEADVRARAFEPFFTTKPSGVGTGLGLSTVYGIVTQSGGHLWLYSERGKGTIVRIYLPRVAAPELETRAAEAPMPRATGHVLLVEDEDSVRTVVRAVLERRGYDVLEASDPERALAIADEHEDTFVLVVADVVMPGMSGPDLVARLRASRPGLRVLYMSGYAEDDDVLRAIADKGSAFLQKPFSADDLGRAVRDVLESEAG